MRNPEVERILNDIALYLEMDDVPFKLRAYEKAARSIEALQEDVEDIYRRGSGKKRLGDPGRNRQYWEIERFSRVAKVIETDCCDLKSFLV